MPLDGTDDPTACVSGIRHRSGPRPFLKWAGGKTQLLGPILESISSRLPKPFLGTYIEPFVGGGAVFFELARRELIHRARLYDRNEELVAAYRAVRDELPGVIAELATHKNDEAHFYEVRDQEPTKLTLAERAARTIFLNRVGFNGLYRVNASGRFNVPFGRYTNPKICDKIGLEHASHALKMADVDVADFERACAGAAPGDVVYLDPPYVPLTKTANFTAYAATAFGEAEHRRLADVFRRVVKRGAIAVLSNSDTPLTRELYRGFKIRTVEATRAINSKADRRGVVNEILVEGALS